NENEVNQTEQVAVEPQPSKKELKKQAKLEAKQAKEAQKAKDSKKAKKQNSEPKKNKAKETVAELKKVTWPTFGKVVKNTLIVLGIVVGFTIVLFCIDRILSWLFQLMVDGKVTNWFGLIK
ncbi:MAG TPA: preprotein translocase subunit SecE, partial [Clostridiales bacterium]|nr:preprotein translocase subunit SecE [Clostridiales bacterium]